MAVISNGVLLYFLSVFSMQFIQTLTFSRVRGLWKTSSLLISIHCLIWMGISAHLCWKKPWGTMALSFWSLPPLLVKLCLCEIKYSFALWKFKTSSPDSDSRMVLRLRNRGNEWKHRNLKGRRDGKDWCRNTSVSDIKISNETCPAASQISTLHNQSSFFLES